MQEDNTKQIFNMIGLVLVAILLPLDTMLMKSQPMDSHMRALMVNITHYQNIAIYVGTLFATIVLGVLGGMSKNPVTRVLMCCCSALCIGYLCFRFFH